MLKKMSEYWGSSGPDWCDQFEVCEYDPSESIDFVHQESIDVKEFSEPVSFGTFAERFFDDDIPF